ncbi:hypothetical protein NCER_101012 [Vairimorpha ceranae BRL01]|uniref:Uncharacterized protein n=2 Tax=Vairimorpha ceranae TaxID=40302 RepID=C4V904_VAIC1|nr:hypothetical protein AAJ76_540005226 [Vairimorpha ceranae]EEQ82300.1 hypothetical protein NCER_101012 [Vairimorpha ceranae BRL01]KAF5141589.1 hypothetical protein G9O61_00g001310 [Vairimorpha ceranae]KKO74633.1 hypothetical protein AAJ76_540005226 [Vairimorpha ceranae]
MKSKDLNPNNIYDFFLQKIILNLANTHLSKHVSFLSNYNIKIGVYDFCGKLKTYSKYFIDFAECWVVENDWENDITINIYKYDLVYFFDDIELVDRNLFYNKVVSRSNYLFVLFTKNRFSRIEVYIDEK